MNKYLNLYTVKYSVQPCFNALFVSFPQQSINKYGIICIYIKNAYYYISMRVCVCVYSLHKYNIKIQYIIQYVVDYISIIHDILQYKCTIYICTIIFIYNIPTIDDFIYVYKKFCRSLKNTNHFYLLYYVAHYNPFLHFFRLSFV